MRFGLCFLFALLTLAGRAQDEFPDYRSKRENFVKMPEKDLRGDLASFVLAGIDESTGKLPLKKISPAEAGTNFIRFEGNGIQVAITTAPFVAANHKLKLFDEKHLVRIDNKPFYGSFGVVPKTMIRSVSVLINKDTVQIPETAYSDLFNPSFSYSNEGTQKTLDAVYLSNDNKTFYIYLLSRDATGGFEVTRVIRDKKYLRRVVDYGLMK